MKQNIFTRAHSLLLIGVVYLAIVLPSARCDPLEICQPRNTTYNIGDSKQCDKYWQCTKGGKSLERLCSDGFVFSLEISQCEYPHNVNCSARPILQPSQSTDPNCPRSNGFYPFPASDSCQKFYHCLEGVAYEKTCPEGVIFEPAKGTCMHPDLTRRPECAAKEVLNFTCPNSVNRFAKLRFGDHDRHSHPTDCRKFMICLRDGRPRIAGCPLGKVFNGKSGFCDSPKRVVGCNDYYGKQDIAKLLQESDSEDFVFGDPTNTDENEVDDHPIHKQAQPNFRPNPQFQTDEGQQTQTAQEVHPQQQQPKPIKKTFKVSSQ